MTSTDPLVNTFVAGDIQIELKEHVLDANTGKWASPETYTVAGNPSILALPGRTIQKDPAVTVLKGSEPCYLRVLVKIHWPLEADPLFQQFSYKTWFNFGQSWKIDRIFDGTTVKNGRYVGHDIYEFRYNQDDGIVDAVNSKTKFQFAKVNTRYRDFSQD